MKEKAPKPEAREKREKREKFEYAHRSIASETHPSRNEDALIQDEELKLIAVCDGMGGYAGGREASQRAAAAIREGVRAWDEVADDEADELIRTSLGNVLVDASREVLELGHEMRLAIANAEEREKFHEPGTTAAVVRLHEFADGRRTAYVASVGDSRVYVWRAEARELEQVSEDHDSLSEPDSVHQLEEKFQRTITPSDIASYRALLDSVHSEAQMPDALGKHLFQLRNVITRALGGGQGLRAHTYAVELTSGDVILVTSDGVHDNLTRQRMAAIAQTSASVDVLTERLAAEAYEYGHSAPRLVSKSEPRVRNKRDDITVVAVKA